MKPNTMILIGFVMMLAAIGSIGLIPKFRLTAVRWILGALMTLIGCYGFWFVIIGAS